MHIRINQTLFGITLLFFFAVFFVLPVYALAAEVNVNLPGSTAGSQGNPAGIVTDLYRFALMGGGLLAFAVIVYGGIRYAAAAGNPSGQGEGKEWVRQAIYGLLLLVGGYFILSTINPSLTNLGLPTLERLAAPVSGPGSICAMSCPQGEYCALDANSNPYCQPYPPAGGSGACSTITCGGCSGTPGQLGGCSWDPVNASGIVRAESGGNPFAASVTDKCQDGKSFSYGLFQINLTVHDIGGLNCPAAFSGRNYACRVVNQTLYDQCVQAATNPNTNVQKACQIFQERLQSGRVGWSAWGANSVCRFSV
jgi:hypothetical protein